MPDLQVRTIVSMPFAENTYLAWLPGRREAVVIDPGLEPDLIFDALDAEQLTVAAILNTHGHADHIAGNAAMKQRYPAAPLVIGRNEAHLLTDADANLSASYGMPIVSPKADRELSEGEVLEVAGMTLEVREIPGHSPGHIVYLQRGEPIQVFGGDVLFHGSIGRYDFPGGNGRLLLDGIRTKLFDLPDDTVVYPGHGAATTIGEERRTNPFLT